MASRIMHLAVAKEVIKHTNIYDKNRFNLGCILPDAYNSQVNKSDSHLKIFVCGNSKKTYDLEKFRDLYGDKMKVDALYLGYYMHLIQDLLFRELVYGKYKWNPMLPGNVERLHNDYRLINQYVIEKYQILPEISLPIDFQKEEIYQLYPFCVDNFLADMENDFIKTNENEIFFFSKEMADEFIYYATKVCVEEYQHLVKGVSGIDAYDYAWINKPYSLLETTQNTRDLGGYRKNNGLRTKEFSLLRSDVQNYPNERDIEFLKMHGITTIIDMRGAKDIVRKPSGFEEHPVFTYYNFQIDEGSGVPDSYEVVPESYLQIAEARLMVDVFRCIANASSGVMFNCTAGKDRTGVVSAILLMHMGVCDEDVIENYVLTKKYGKERLELIHKNFPDIDMNIVTPCKFFMEEFMCIFRKKYGNTESYFKTIGLTDDEIQRINRKL